MRALRPDLEGFVGRDGTRVHYEVFGAGERTLMLLPPWSIVSSRHWKFQVPYLARHFRIRSSQKRERRLSIRRTRHFRLVQAFKRVQAQFRRTGKEIIRMNRLTA